MTAGGILPAPGLFTSTPVGPEFNEGQPTQDSPDSDENGDNDVQQGPADNESGNEGGSGDSVSVTQDVDDSEAEDLVKLNDGFIGAQSFSAQLTRGQSYLPGALRAPHGAGNT